jgi:tRNA threonylcarbamoyladenosine biosynthesis protein TsaE
VRRIEVASPEEMFAAGEALARELDAGDVVGLVGELGAGKTVFIQGLARGLGVPPEVPVTSPTFTLVNEYRGGRLPLFHVDLYRLEREDQLEDVGLDELYRRGDGVVAVEWFDRFPGAAARPPPPGAPSRPPRPPGRRGGQEAGIAAG